MKKILILVLMMACLSAQAAEYIYPGALTLIDDKAFTVENSNSKAFLVKYSFPELVEIKRVDLEEIFPIAYGSESGFLVSHYSTYEWDSGSDEDIFFATKKRNGTKTFSGDFLTETVYYTSYNSDLEKVTDKTITNVYFFDYIYEDDTDSFVDDGLATTVEDKFCSGAKKKGKKNNKCKKFLLRTK